MTTLELPPDQEAAPALVRWTRAQVRALLESDILDRNHRYELIEGVLYEMSENPLHANAVVALIAWLHAVFGSLFVRSQTAIELGDADSEHSSPLPDAFVTREAMQAYLSRFPGPEDLLLVVEASNSTLRFDLSRKAALYATAGIQEYWVMDINGRRLVAHRVPTPSGYAQVRVYAEGERVATLARPDRDVLVSELLPPLA